MAKKISYKEFLHREYDFQHAPLEGEMEFYDAISLGNKTMVKKLIEELLPDKEGLGTLSKDPLRNMKYHFTISTAMIARSCIKRGLPHVKSYSISDAFIQKADEAKSIWEISDLHQEMCWYYTETMHKLHKETICSKPVNLCINYVYENLHTRITVEDLAEVTDLSPSYLSRLFKKETGISISDYITAKKIETAKSMLAYSDYSISEIANALAFPSQSYMTTVIKKECGMTPREYRNQSHALSPLQ